MVGNRITGYWSGSICALLLWCTSAAALHAAEVRGSVEISRQGLFKSESSQLLPSVAVALLPAEDQRLPARKQQRHRVEISGNRMRPAFLAVQRGSTIEVVNRDDVYHQLFSVSTGEPISVRLNKAGEAGGDRVAVDFMQSGTTHLFCRIHKKSYARLDVVDTPYLRMVKPGEQFRFSGLAPGNWKLRLSAPAAETRWVEVTAHISPPVLELELAAYGGGSHTPLSHSSADIERLYGD
jgi:plastocyanin